MNEFKQNDERYEQCAIDHGSKQVANAAIQAFFDDVQKLRERYGIAGLYLFAQCNYSVVDDRGGKDLMCVHSRVYCGKQDEILARTDRYVLADLTSFVMERG